MLIIIVGLGVKSTVNACNFVLGQAERLWSQGNFIGFHCNETHSGYCIIIPCEQQNPKKVYVNFADGVVVGELVMGEIVEAPEDHDEGIILPPSASYVVEED